MKTTFKYITAILLYNCLFFNVVNAQAQSFVNYQPGHYLATSDDYKSNAQFALSCLEDNPSPPKNEELVFEDDFTGNTLSGIWARHNSGTSQFEAVSGKGVAVAAQGTQRTEVQANRSEHIFRNGVLYRIKFRIYPAVSTAQPSWGTIVMQLHATPGQGYDWSAQTGRNPITFVWKHSTARLNLHVMRDGMGNPNGSALGPFSAEVPVDNPQGKWTDIEIEFRLSPNADGYVRVLANGVQFFEQHGRNMDVIDAGGRPAADGDCYLKLGIYKDPGLGNHETWYDDVRVTKIPACGGPDIWVNTPFTTATGTFTAEFDATPSGNNIDGVVGLSNAPAAAFTSLACDVRFNSTGTIDVRNGDTYQSDVTMSYTAGTTFHIKMNVNIVTKKYDVYVTPQSGTQQTLAAQYNFRTEQNTVTQLNSCTKNTIFCSINLKNLNVQIITAVGFLYAPSELTIYPNPFSETTTIDFSNIQKSSGDVLSFHLYNLLGKEVAAYTNITDDMLVLEKMNLAEGLYLCKVLIKGENIGNGKLIIQ